MSIEKRSSYLKDNSLTEIIEFIVLGQTEPSIYGNAHDISICTAGWSEAKGFVRIIPVRPKDVDLFKRWNIVRVNVSKTKKDTRNETYHLVDVAPIEVLGEYPKKDRRVLIEEISTNDCTLLLNEQRRSLAVIKPIIQNYYTDTNISNNEDSGKENGQQLLLTQFLNDYDDYMKDKNLMDNGYRPSVHQSNPYRFRVVYKCGSECMTKNSHDQTILDWGIALLIRKNEKIHPEYLQNWGDAYKFENPDYDHFFLIGNLRDYRTTWIVATPIFFKKEKEQKNISLDSFTKITKYKKENRKKIIQESWQSIEKPKYQTLPGVIEK